MVALFHLSLGPRRPLVWALCGGAVPCTACCWVRWGQTPKCRLGKVSQAVCPSLVAGWVAGEVSRSSAMLPHGPLAWAWRWQDPAGHAVQHYHRVSCPRHEPTVTSSDSKTPQNAPNMKSSHIPNPAADTWLMKSLNMHWQRRCELLNTTKHAFSWILGACRQPSRR